MMAKGEKRIGIWASGLRQNASGLSHRDILRLLRHKLMHTIYFRPKRGPHSFAELYSTTDSGTLDTM